MDADFCFLFGNHNAPEDCRSAVLDALEKCYTENNIKCYVVVMYGNFDRIGRFALKMFKKQHSDIALYLLTPYHPYQRPIEVPQGFDATYYPPEQEKALPQFAIVKANEYCAKNCSAAICYVKNPGNSRKILEKQKRRAEIPIYNVAENIE